MNTLMLVALAVVALCYCGGKYCPKVLSSNKEMLLGVLVGMALCSFMDLRMEGFDGSAWVSNGCCKQERLSGKCLTLFTDSHNISDWEEMRDEINRFCPQE